MRCGILTLRQGYFWQNRKIPTGLQDHFCFDQFIPAPGHNVKRVIFNLSELAGYWAHMMRKGTGAAFVRMPDDREGKMVLEYVCPMVDVFLLIARNQQAVDIQRAATL